MLSARALFTHPALRLFHSATARPQQVVSVQQQVLAGSQHDASAAGSQQNESVQQQDPAGSLQELAMDNLAGDVESVPSTHRGAAVTRSEAPQEIFEAWKANRFYAPLAFLRSRRILASPKRNKPPAVGPGAAQAAYNDVFRQLDIDPVDEVNNQTLLSDFVTTMGKIQPRSYTRLSWWSQRRITQAIKRSKQKGLMPIAGRVRGFVPRIVPNHRQ